MAVKECEEIQGWLSDYLEGNLDSGRHRAVEDHLYLCPICLAQSEALTDTIESLKSLPSVEPPPGFSARVMARVREEAGRPGLWERLFVPLRIKVPLEAAALVVVAVLAVTVYHKNEMPQRKDTERAPAEAPMTAAGDLRETDLGEAPPAASSFAPAEERGRPEGRVAPAGALTSKDARIEGLRESSATLRADRAGKKEAASESFDQAEAAGSFELVLQLQNRDENEAVVQRRIDTLVKALNGQRLLFADTVEEQKAESSAPPQTLWIVLPADRFERFKAELAALGAVTTGRIVPGEPAVGAQGPSQLRIHLKVLPAPGSKG